MQVVIARRPVKRKRLVALRPRPDLEFFFNRYKPRRPAIDRFDAGSRSDLYGLETRTRLQDRR
jgi:hypothetical protein